MENHRKLIHFLRADPPSSPRSFSSNSSVSDDDGSSSYSSPSVAASAASSPSSRYSTTSPPRSPWAAHHVLPGLGGNATDTTSTTAGLVASLVKEDGGKVYSLAAAGDVLYTGTDSETVRVWRRDHLVAGFRTGSGLVKAIVVARDGRVFTGHQDGKIRVWRRADADGHAVHRRVGSLPALGDYLVSSVNPSCYVDTPRRCRRRRRAVWLRHTDAVSCLSLDEDAGLLYSGSWDRTLKVWRLADSRCLESVHAHDDAVNTVAAAGFHGLVFSGSADGAVKVWRRELVVAATADPIPIKGDKDKDTKTRHVLDRVLRKGDNHAAVTAIAVATEARVVYVGTSDGLVTYCRWLDNGDPVFGGVLKGHGTMAVMCLAVSGTVVVSGSADRTLCVWRRRDDDCAEHSRLAVLAGHTGPVKCVAVAHEDNDDADGYDRRFVVVYSGSLDGSVKVWRLQLDDHARDDSPSPSPRAAAATEQQYSSLLPTRDPQAWQPLPSLPSPPVQSWAPHHQQAPELKHVAASWLHRL